MEFFRRTYLTEGLKDLLLRTARRIGGDMNASPVVNLQTNFGGGKTHSMLALWHLLSGTELTEYPDELQKLLAGHDIGALGRSRGGSRWSATTSRPGRARSSARRHAREDAVGRAGLAARRGARRRCRGARGIRDRRGRRRDPVNPGAALRPADRAYAPCLILIDEWVAYARQLYGRDDLDGGTFDTQFTFAQTLTEAVKAVPGAMLVVSIPASSESPSEEEAETRALPTSRSAGMNGREALARLQQVIRRIADQWRPATH